MVKPFLNLLDGGETSHNNTSLLETPEKGANMVLKEGQKS